MTDLDVPEGLHELQYARHIAEEILAWPATKSNLELIGGAITAIAKHYRKTAVTAYKNLVERIEEARRQQIEINGHFFRDGEYMNVRRNKVDVWKVHETHEARFAAHGCMNGWVYADKGVKRCEKCRGGQ